MTRFMLPAKLAFLVIAAFATWQGVVFLRPAPREFTEAEILALDAASRQVCDELSAVLTNTPRVAVAHLVGDSNDDATESLRQAAAKRSEWSVLTDQSPVEKFLTDVFKAVKNATTLEEIANAGTRVELDAVLAGKVVSVTPMEDGGRAEIWVTAYDLRRGQTVYGKTVVGTWKPRMFQRIRNSAGRMPGLARFALWLAFVILLPLATPFAAHWAVEQKSNGASFLLLAVYTGLDLFAGLFMAGFETGGFVRGSLTVVAFLFCAAWNYWICERIAAQ